MKQTALLFIAGVTLALLAIGGYFVAQSYFVSADGDAIPENINIERVSPTSGIITFTTAKPVIASIECAVSSEGPFSLCGAETQSTTNHEIKTSIILNPEAEYYFFIKIKNTTYDNLGNPFTLAIKESKKAEEFPKNLLGVCKEDAGYDVSFDINKDGCIRQNDMLLYVQ
jgi:hypothetical protein